MKYRIIISFLLSLLFVMPVSAQEPEIEKEFIKTVEQTRDRIMTMHGEGELATVQYEEERAVVRQAEQVEQLLREGKDVDEKTLRDWIQKLNRLGRTQSKEGEGVQYREKPWPAAESNLSKKIVSHQKKLEQKYKAGDVDEKTYMRNKEKLQSMQTKLEKLNAKMSELNNQMKELEGQVSQFEKDMN